MAELTRAQLAALEVLATYPDSHIDGGHHVSSVRARRVNTIAAAALCEKGFARPVFMWDAPRTFFRVTEAGKAAWQQFAE